MKKALILAMSCRETYFQKEIENILKTWAKFLPDNIDFAWYDGMWDKAEVEKIDDKHFHIHANVPDNLDYTFMKTMSAIRTIYKNYDYILRTNTSTWVNVKLLSKLVDEFLENNKVYATDMYSLTEACAPAPLDIYARGNCILMSSDMWMNVCKYGIPLIHMKVVDDVAIGNIINSYLMITRGDYLQYYVGLPHGWYKSSKTLFDNHHALCRYGEHGDADFYKGFLTVQTKMYRDRETEIANMMEFAEIMKDIEPSLDLCKSYSNDPSIFIGSAIGYIPLSTWQHISKAELHNIEMNNKAIDDKSSPIFSQAAYDELHYVPKE